MMNDCGGKDGEDEFDLSVMSTSSLDLVVQQGPSTRISNELREGRPKAAKLAARVILLIALVEGLLLSRIAVAARNMWGYMYTNKEEVVKYLAASACIVQFHGRNPRGLSELCALRLPSYNW